MNERMHLAGYLCIWEFIWTDNLNANKQVPNDPSVLFDAGSIHGY